MALLVLTWVGLVAGGTGGYLLRATTAAQQNAPAQVLVAPTTSSYGALNADSINGYGTSTSVGISSAALNGDSTSGY